MQLIDWFYAIISTPFDGMQPDLNAIGSHNFSDQLHSKREREKKERKERYVMKICQFFFHVISPPLSLSLSPI